MQLKNCREERDLPGYIEARQWRIDATAFDRYRLRFISGLLKARPSGRLVEIGCDIGLAAKAYSTSASEVVLCDREAFALRGAKIINESTRPRPRFVSADLCALPFKSGLFDTVVCFEVIEHLDKAFHRKALDELMRIAKSGASIFISTPNRISVPGLEGKLLELFVSGYKWSAWDTDHKYVYKTGEFVELIAKGPCRIESIYGFYFLPGSAMVRLPLPLQKFLGFLSYLFSKYFGAAPFFRSVGFTTIVKFRKN